MNSHEQSPITIYSSHIVSPLISITHPSTFLARFSHGFPRAKSHNDTFLIYSFTSHFNHTSQHFLARFSHNTALHFKKEIHFSLFQLPFRTRIPADFWHDFRTTPPYTLRKQFPLHCFPSHFEHASQHISGTIFAWIPPSKVLAVTEREKKRRVCVLEMLSEMDARKRGCEPKKLACKSSQLLTSHFLLLYRVDSPEQSPHNDYTLSLSK